MTAPDPGPPPEGPPRPSRVDLDELAALEEQRDFLLGSLDDLEREHEAGDLDDVDFEVLRADYTARAARVIEAIETREELIDATAPSQRGLRRILAIVAVAIVAVVAGIVVTSTSGSHRERAEDAAMVKPSAATQVCIDKMGTTFGGAGGSGSGTDFATDAVATLKCFTSRIEADPSDVVALTYRGRVESLLARQLEGVASPDDVANFVRRADADFTRALELEPDFADALAFAAMHALQTDRVAVARGYLARLDALGLPANDPILPIVNNVLRPAISAAEADSSSTTSSGVPTSGPATGPATTAAAPAPGDG